MKLVELSKVKVGSTITVRGEFFKVTANWTSDLVLTNEDGEIYYFNHILKDADLVPKGANHLVVVSEEPGSQDLAADLREQLAKNSLKAQLTGANGGEKNLTESLKAQIEGKNKPSLTENLRAQVTSLPALSTDSLTSLKVDAVNSKVDTLRTQLAQNALRTNEANVKADGVNVGIQDLSQALEEQAYENELRIQRVSDDVENVADGLDDLDGEVAGMGIRIYVLEEEKRQRDLQAKLNQKLAQNGQTIKAQSAQNQGGNSMKNVLASFKNLFGKVEGQFALSMFGGTAIRKAPFSQEWVTYDAQNGITDVQGNVLKFDVPAFRLPVEPKAVKKGNIVVAQNGTYGYVTEVSDGFVKVIFPATAAQGTVLPVRNPLLNKSFYTVVQILDLAGGETGGFNPMLLMAMGGEGNKSDLLPLLLASGGLGGKEGQIDPMTLMMISDGAEDILPLLLLQQGGFAQEGMNPLMLLALGDKGGKSSDLLPLLLATGGAGGAAGMQGILPFLLMGDDKGGDFKDLLMMQAMTGQNLFGAPAAAPKVEENKVADAE